MSCRSDEVGETGGGVVGVGGTDSPEFKLVHSPDFRLSMTRI